ncbi:hypothetical protein B0H10DRAFT_1953326 [Mycena sp. CBHHK59/15]|nr:hypothetical protein B0H10DRAFT_1953326 [Mycena sp. CBHHK59/15]
MTRLNGTRIFWRASQIAKGGTLSLEKTTRGLFGSARKQVGHERRIIVTLRQFSNMFVAAILKSSVENPGKRRDKSVDLRLSSSTRVAAPELTSERTEIRGSGDSRTAHQLFKGASQQEYSGSVSVDLLHTYLLYCSGLLLSIAMFCISPGKLHLYIKCFHDTYSPVVWIGSSSLPSSGPNDLSAINYGRDSAYKTKRPRFPRATAIKGYEPILIWRVVQLVDKLRAQKKGSIDLSQWISFFGCQAFNLNADLVEALSSCGLETKTVFDINQSMACTLTQQIPWSMNFLLHLPLGQEMKALGKFASCKKDQTIYSTTL